MRLVLLIAAASLVAAACGSAGSTATPPSSVGPSAAAASAPAASPTAPPTSGTPTAAPATAAPSQGSPAPTNNASPAPSAAAGQSPDTTVGSHVAPDLEALLPTLVNEIPLTLASNTGAAVFDPEDPASQGMIAFLASNGKTPADLVFAQAYDASGGLDLFLAAFRVSGMDPGTLRNALLEVGLANGSEQSSSATTMGGKPITKVVYPAGGSNSYLYERNGVVFDVETKDEALATQILSQLP